AWASALSPVPALNDSEDLAEGGVGALLEELRPTLTARGVDYGLVEDRFDEEHERYEVIVDGRWSSGSQGRCDGACVPARPVNAWWIPGAHARLGLAAGPTRSPRGRGRAPWQASLPFPRGAAAQSGAWPCQAGPP